MRKINIYLKHSGYLVDAECGHVFQITVGKTIGNRHFYGTKNIVPCGLKGLGNLFPGKTLRPCCKKPGIGGGQVIFPFSPGNLLHLNVASGACHTPHAVQKKYRDIPQWDKLEASHLQGIVAGTSQAAPRADRTA